MTNFQQFSAMDLKALIFLVPIFFLTIGYTVKEYRDISADKKIIKAYIFGYFAPVVILLMVEMSVIFSILFQWSFIISFFLLIFIPISLGWTAYGNYSLLKNKDKLRLNKKEEIEIRRVIIYQCFISIIAMLFFLGILITS